MEHCTTDPGENEKSPNWALLIGSAVFASLSLISNGLMLYLVRREGVNAVSILLLSLCVWQLNRHYGLDVWCCHGKPAQELSNSQLEEKLLQEDPEVLSRLPLLSPSL